MICLKPVQLYLMRATGSYCTPGISQNRIVEISLILSVRCFSISRDCKLTKNLIQSRLSTKEIRATNQAKLKVTPLVIQAHLLRDIQIGSQVLASLLFVTLAEVQMPRGTTTRAHLIVAINKTACSPLPSELSGAPNGNFRENICSENDLRSRIFGTFVVKFLACLPLLGFSNIYKTV